MPDVIEYYVGLLPRNRVIACPFHKEKTPSLRVYEHGFYCFGCGAGGDIINFTARLFTLSNHEAAEKLDSDFGLGLTDAEYDAVADMKYTYAKKLSANAEKRFKQKINELCEIRYSLWCIRFEGIATTEAQAQRYAHAQAAVEFLDYIIDYSMVDDLKEVEKIARRFSGETDRGQHT